MRSMKSSTVCKLTIELDSTAALNERLSSFDSIPMARWVVAMQRPQVMQQKSLVAIVVVVVVATSVAIVAAAASVELAVLRRTLAEIVDV